MSRKRDRSASPIISTGTYKSSPIVDRSSTFIAVYSPCFSAKALQELPEFKPASHCMTAWRKSSSQQSLDSQPLFETGHDDDGEKYGGKTLEKVLVNMNVQGAVVVARWYGGVMLGPMRFDHMRKSATEAVRMWMHENERLAKKPKIENDEKRREHLVKVLGERDQSITVLRGLLAEKTQAVSSQDSGKSSVPKPPDYSNMPLATLEKLEHVKDKTIGWILDKIEKAEEMERKEPITRAPVTGEPGESGESGKLDDGSTTVDESSITHLDNDKGGLQPPSAEVE